MVYALFLEVAFIFVDGICWANGMRKKHPRHSQVGLLGSGRLDWRQLHSYIPIFGSQKLQSLDCEESTAYWDRVDVDIKDSDSDWNDRKRHFLKPN